MPKQTRRFSVVIPTHNRLALLQNTLACLERQTLARDQYEVIVVDNGSQDGTQAYLESAADGDRLLYVRQAALGPAVARNVGIELARGDIIAFTDDDCLPPPNWLRRLAELYDAHASAELGGIGGHVQEKTGGHWLANYYAIALNRTGTYSTTVDFLDTANASYRRDVLQAVGRFHARVPFPSAEDCDLGYRIVDAGYRLHIDSTLRVEHLGRRTLRGLLRQSWDRGNGRAFLNETHPQRRLKRSEEGWRGHIWRGVDWLNTQTNRPRWRWLRPIYRFPIMFVIALALGWQYLRHNTPRQWRKGRSLHFSAPHTAALICLGCASFAVTLLSQTLAQTFWLPDAHLASA